MNTYYKRRRNTEELREENLIRNSFLKPEEKTLFKGHVVTIKYPTIKDGLLVYLAHIERLDEYFWLPDQI